MYDKKSDGELYSLAYDTKIGDIVTVYGKNCNYYQMKIMGKKYNNIGDVVSIDVEKGWFTGNNDDTICFTKL